MSDAVLDACLAQDPESKVACETSCKTGMVMIFGEITTKAQVNYEQVVRNAEPHFALVESSSGRLDYIETIAQWRRRFAQPSLRKTLLKAQLVPRWLTSADFRLAFTSGVSANTVCFQRELLDHYRLVFEKR